MMSNQPCPPLTVPDRFGSKRDVLASLLEFIRASALLARTFEQRPLPVLDKCRIAAPDGDLHREASLPSETGEATRRKLRFCVVSPAQAVD